MNRNKKVRHQGIDPDRARNEARDSAWLGGDHVVASIWRWEGGGAGGACSKMISSWPLSALGREDTHDIWLVGDDGIIVASIQTGGRRRTTEVHGRRQPRCGVNPEWARRERWGGGVWRWERGLNDALGWGHGGGTLRPRGHPLSTSPVRCRAN